MAKSYAQLHGKRVVVMGLGRFGGGIGVTRFLIRHRANVLVTDLAPAAQLRDSLVALDGLEFKARLGEHCADDFIGADLIVVNPAVDPRDNKYLQAAHHAGVPTTTEIGLLVQRLPNRMRTIGVTGTAGKSTTTAMIGHILRKTLGEDRVHVGGNIGGSLLESLDNIHENDWVVLELSSFMLESLNSERWSPHLAVVTNLAPNHLDRHGTYSAYMQAKRVILDYQDMEHDVACLGPGVQKQGFVTHRHTRHLVGFNDAIVPDDLTIPLPGRHNQHNAYLAELTVSESQIASCGEARQGLSDFTGLPHRLQLIAEHAGVRYFNDSKSTTPDAALLAIESFDRGKVHVIVGGYDKKSDLSKLVACVAERCRAVYTVGATGGAIADECDAASDGTQVVRCTTVDRAVRETTTRVHAGEVVLLSPGCASWDQFDNYESRGAAFVEAVLRYPCKGAPPVH